ncbi:MAG: hypothetical protein GC193_08550 [Cryomorphaceae bacterium]|nr:hypothetical protein [Cryomorphaceae bacterium]
MTFNEFTDLFPDEESCKIFIKQQREKQGLQCRKCNCKRHYWKSDKEVWECSHCKYRMSLKAGTAMHGSKLKLKTWFTAYYFVLQTKKSFSSCEMQRILGLSRYETVWYLIHRIRQQMAKHNLDQFYKSMFDNISDYQIQVKTRIQKKSKNSVKVAFILKESLISNVNKIKPDKLLVVAAESAGNSKEPTNRYRLLIKDYQNKYGFKNPQKENHQIPSWVVNTAVNANRILDGIHHLPNPGLSQLYFDEFSFKYNYKKIKHDLKSMIIRLFTEVGSFADNQTVMLRI